MAKLHFYYLAMNAGKTTTLLQSSYNYYERGMNTMLFKPTFDTRLDAAKLFLNTLMPNRNFLNPFQVTLS